MAGKSKPSQGYNEQVLYWFTMTLWPGLILWIILYISDYYLTLYAARGFKELDHIRFEGSFELTPQYQKDIDTLKPVSRRHIIALALSSLTIILLWWLTRLNFYLELAYPLFLGMFLLLEVAIHLRHFRNVGLIRTAKKHGGIEGQITYKKWFSYRNSANDLYIMSGFFLFIAVLTFGPFFFGGAITCLATGIQHSRLARKAKLIPLQTVDPNP